MTSTPVSNVTDFSFVTRKDSMQSPKGENDFAGSLKSAVEKNDQGQVKSQKEDAPVGKTERKPEEKPVEPERVNSKVSTEEKTEKSMDEKVSALNEGEELSDEAKEVVSDKTSRLLKMVSEITGYSEEDILKAMETLGIAPVELIVPENQISLLMELDGTDDPMALVTDEGLYQSLKTIGQDAKDILLQMEDATGLSEEELIEVGKQIETVEPAVTAVTEDLVKTNFVPDAEQEIAPIVQETVQTKIPVRDNTSEKTSFQTAEPASVAEEATETNQTQPVVAVEEEASKQEDESFPEQEQNTALPEAKAESTGESNEIHKTMEIKTEKPVRETQDAQTQPQTNTAQVAQPLTETSFETETKEVAEHLERMSDTQQIADQIMEHMKVQMKEGITELEMQLHPASLGNVNVSLVSREGNITAQFTAQNEAVKSVIESQIVQLREQFEEQGIKVEAVEVAVANHQFEKQNGGEEQPKQFQRNVGSAKRTRRINLEELDDEEIAQLMEDSDKIQVEMMKQNGNTVDFTA